MIILAERGKSEYRIVCGENASLSEKTAIAELQKYLEQITGINFPVVTDAEKETAKEIIVGRTNREQSGQFSRDKWKDEGFIIQTEGDKLWIVGSEKRGTLYGVYTFLEDHLGCRFFTRKVEKIPTKDTLVLDEITDEQIPTFPLRDAAWNDYIHEDFSVKRKINFSTWCREFEEQHGGGYAYAKTGGHSFFLFVDPKEYFETHPEYFTMDEKGERVSNKQLCLTNPEVFELVKKGARQWLQEEPHAQILTFSQTDWGGPCLCENCRKVYEEEGGSYSGSLLRFVNALAEDLEKDYPDVWVDTFAYQYTRSVPTKTKPRHNVMIRLCTMGCDFSKPHEISSQKNTSATYLDGTSNTFPEDLNGWTEICNNVFIFEYNSNFQHYIQFFPDIHRLKTNFEYFARRNCLGVMAEGNYQSPSVEMGELRAYLLSKALWNPFMSLEEYDAHMDDFLNYVYGPGGKYIRQYIELAEETTAGIGYHLSSDPDEMWPYEIREVHKEGELPEDLSAEKMRAYEETDWSLYREWYVQVGENRVSLEGEELFKKAMEEAENEEQKKRIENISLQVEYLKSFYYRKKIDMAKESLEKVLKTYVEEHSEEFTEGEKASLADEIVAYVYNRDLADYAAYNKDFLDRLMAAGVTDLYSGLAIEKFRDKFEFSRPPVDWFERFWLNVN